MSQTPPLFPASRRAIVGAVGFGILLTLLGRALMAETPPKPAPAPVTLATPLPPLEQPQEELAEYMGQLQIYTHKLSLAAAAMNKPLAELYLHESVALLQKMQESFPEYERIPVALLIDRMALSAYEPLKAALAKPAADLDKAALDQGMEAILNTCNACHTASQVPFIRIERNPFNPFMQNFQPLDSAK